MLYQLGRKIQNVQWQVQWFLAKSKHLQKNAHCADRVRQLEKDLKSTYKIVNRNGDVILKDAVYYSACLCVEMFNYAMCKKESNLTSYVLDIKLENDFTSFQVGFCYSVIENILSCLEKTVVDNPPAKKKLKRKITAVRKRLPMVNAQMRMNQEINDDLNSTAFYIKEKVRLEVQKTLLMLFSETIEAINYYISQWK